MNYGRKEGRKEGREEREEKKKKECILLKNVKPQLEYSKESTRKIILKIHIHLPYNNLV